MEMTPYGRLSMVNGVMISKFSLLGPSLILAVAVAEGALD